MLTQLSPRMPVVWENLRHGARTYLSLFWFKLNLNEWITKLNSVSSSVQNVKYLCIIV